VTWAAGVSRSWTTIREAARLRTPFSDAVDRRLERLCLKNAITFAVTDAAHDLLARKVIGPQQFVVVRNGIDRLTPPGRRPVAGTPPDVHSREYLPSADPRPFLRALASCTGGADWGKATFR